MAIYIRNLFIVLGAFALLLLPSFVYASVSCADLDTNEKIQTFIQKSQSTTPLLRNNISVMIALSPCEGKVCRSKKTRRRHREEVHFVRMGSNQRFFFKKGPSAPQCLIRRGSREFGCTQCDTESNESCRSFPSSDSKTLRGSNIDGSDFEQLVDSNHESRCVPLKKNPKFLKIITVRKEGDSPYDRIVSFFDRKKEVPITMNYFSKKVLRKVYRFFPKYYVQLDGQWFSTVMRVRTTQGSEKKYKFETLVNVLKKNKQYLIYPDLTQDPSLKNITPDSLFITN